MFIPGSPKLKIVHGTLKVFNKYLLNKRLPNNLIYCTLESVKKKKKVTKWEECYMRNQKMGSSRSPQCLKVAMA